MPLGRWVGLERLEESLEVAVNVADDQDWQFGRGHSTIVVGPRTGLSSEALKLEFAFGPIGA